MHLHKLNFGVDLNKSKRNDIFVRLFFVCTNFKLATIYKDAHVSFPDNVQCSTLFSMLIESKCGKKESSNNKKFQHISPGDSSICNRFDYLALDLGFLSSNLLKDSNLCLWRIAGTLSFFPSFNFLVHFM